MSEKKQELVEIMALWENQSESGETYFTGRMGNAKVIVFKNKYKTSDKHPSYRVYVQNPEKKEKTETPQSSFDENDSIPF